MDAAIGTALADRIDALRKQLDELTPDVSIYAGSGSTFDHEWAVGTYGYIATTKGSKVAYAVNVAAFEAVAFEGADALLRDIHHETDRARLHELNADYSVRLAESAVAALAKTGGNVRVLVTAIAADALDAADGTLYAAVSDSL